MICYRTFQPGDETAFRELNEAWIKSLFAMEEKDHEILSDPATHILKPGGQIVMALDGDKAVGCCALLPKEVVCFELGKMAVHDSHRGKGIGRGIVQFAIEWARAAGAKRLYLESNAKLADAVHLYESCGFTHLPPERVKPSPYARSGVYMEMWL